MVHDIVGIVPKIIHTVKNILQTSPFLRRNAVFFAGSMAVAFLNYLYYPVLGRLLPVAAFGEVQVAVSLLMQVSTILAVLSLIVVNIIVNSQDEESSQRAIRELEKIATYVGIGIVVSVIVAAGTIQRELKFESAWPIILIALMFLFNITGSFRGAFLRGKNDFTGASISGVITSVSKLAISALLVVVGFGVSGAVGGILAAQIVTLVYLISRAKKAGMLKLPASRKPDLSLIRPYLGYAGFVLVVTLLVTTQVSIDATLVKYFFTPDEAGSYAGISTVARIVFFLSGSVAAVMLSAVTLKQTAAKNREMLRKSLLLIVLAAGSATVFFCLFPAFTVHLLLGDRYDAYVGILPLLAVVMLCVSIANLLGTYLIALRRKAALIPAIVGAVTTYLTVAFYHATIEAVVVGLLIGSVIMMLGFGYLCFRPYWKASDSQTFDTKSIS